MKIEIGSRIYYESAAGAIVGVVKNIVLDKNAAGETIPWMIIQPKRGSGFKMCASNSYLKMMKVEVL